MQNISNQNEPDQPSTRKVRFIGDVHGKYASYKKLIADVPKSIQVGDMGVGFRKLQGPRAGEIYANPPHYAMIRGIHRFLRGNHDNPAECRKHSQWIPDGHVEDRMMFVGGGFSIDRAFRVEDYTWWADEELSLAQLNAVVEDYRRIQPEIMITHEPPREVLEAMLARLPTIGNGMEKLERGSRTSQALQQMWNAHSPKLWIFGHMHVAFDHVLHGGRTEGTRFICLPELAHIDLEV